MLDKGKAATPAERNDRNGGCRLHRRFILGAKSLPAVFLIASAASWFPFLDQSAHLNRPCNVKVSCVARLGRRGRGDTIAKESMS